MVISGSTISRAQAERLAQAEAAAPHTAVRIFWDVVSDKGREEPLDPRWKQLWMRLRERVEDEVPRDVINTIDLAMRAIEHVDARIAKIVLRDDEHVCLLFGAGGSAPPPSSIPTVVGLLPELWRRARKLGRDDIDRLANWCNDRKITNIEDLLTAAYLSNFAAKNASVSGLLDYFLFRDRDTDDPRSISRRRAGGKPASDVDAASVALFQDTLLQLFGLLTSTMIPAQPNAAHDAAVSFVQRHPSASIVTTNYDGCIDEAFLKAAVHFDTKIADNDLVTGPTLDLIKIHGSINWTYCESCHEVKEFDLLRLKKGFEDDSVSYAVVGICKNCGGQRRPLLVPPIGLKFILFPNLIRLWNLARDRIEQAKYVVVVGYSFSDADSYINKIIERSMSFNKEKTIIVCDPNPKLAVTLRERFSARIGEFDEARVLAAVGSADKIVPDILSALTEPKTPVGADASAAGNGHSLEARTINA